MADVTERISSGDQVINFLITEAKGSDIDPNGRRGQRHDVCRPRIYVALGDSNMNMEESNEARIEINEPLADVEKNWVRTYSKSLHEFFIFQPRLCESVLTSLTTKIGVISERSAALLQSQLGDEVVKLVTKRLSGEQVEDASLKQLLITQISGAMEKNIVKPIRKVTEHQATEDIVKQLEMEQDELSWTYAWESTMDLEMHWKCIGLHWDGKNGSVMGKIEALCVRDTFLYLVNLPSFGEMIAGKLAKIME